MYIPWCPIFLSKLRASFEVFDYLIQREHYCCGQSFSLQWSRRRAPSPQNPKNKSPIFIYSFGRSINVLSNKRSDRWQLTRHNLLCNSELVGECLSHCICPSRYLRLKVALTFYFDGLDCFLAVHKWGGVFLFLVCNPKTFW